MAAGGRIRVLFFLAEYRRFYGGQRSLLIAQFLQQNGFVRVFNLSGGISAWSEQIDSSVHQY